MRIEPYGPSGWLVCDLDEPAGLADAIAESHILGVVAVRPGATCVLVEFHPTRADGVRERLLRLRSGPVPRFDERVVEATLDLAGATQAAEQIGVDVDTLGFRLGATTARVVCFGPSPASPMMRGLDNGWSRVAPLAEPVATSVGDLLVSRGWCRIQRTSGVTDWTAIATTAVPAWHPSQEPEPDMAPGTRIRFRIASRG